MFCNYTFGLYNLCGIFQKALLGAWDRENKKRYCSMHMPTAYTRFFPLSTVWTMSIKVASNWSKWKLLRMIKRKGYDACMQDSSTSGSGVGLFIGRISGRACQNATKLSISSWWSSFKSLNREVADLECKLLSVDLSKPQLVFFSNSFSLLTFFHNPLVRCLEKKWWSCHGNQHGCCLVVQLPCKTHQ